MLRVRGLEIIMTAVAGRAATRKEEEKLVSSELYVV